MERSGIAFWRALLVTAAAFACVMAFTPEPPRLPGDPPDTYLHALAFAVLALLSRMAFPAAGAFTLLAGLAGLGLAIECVQAIPELGREASVRDWLVDIAASTAVLAALAPLRRGRARRTASGRRV